MSKKATGGVTMKVVDLRNIFANCNDQLIEISDNRIYYAEEKTKKDTTVSSFWNITASPSGNAS